MGDGHTYIRLPPDSPVYPVRFGRFSDQYRLLAAADSRHSPEVAGGRLLSIDDVPVARVHELLLTLAPADEMQPLREVSAAALLSNGLVLHGLGITAERDKVRYRLLTTDGKRVSLEMAATSGVPGSEAGWIQAAAGAALYLQHGENGFWCTYFEDKRTGYCSFRSYKQLKTTSRALKDLMTQQHPENLVIDLRLNDGGDYTLGLKSVVNPIRRAREINHQGHLFVLIGPRTFSAAMANASHFRAKTKAILVGQPIGEKPNSYQEARDMVLPNCRWVARYSVKFYRFSSSGENLIRPDKEIADTWDDYIVGRDPVLAWVLLQVSEEQKQASPPEANAPILFYVEGNLKEYAMEIGPDETEIIGSWLMANGRITEDDATRRISSLIATQLRHVATMEDGWEKALSRLARWTILGAYLSSQRNAGRRSTCLTSCQSREGSREIRNLNGSVRGLTGCPRSSR